MAADVVLVTSSSSGGVDDRSGTKEDVILAGPSNEHCLTVVEGLKVNIRTKKLLDVIQTSSIRADEKAGMQSRKNTAIVS